jgi:hypothetical protein
MRVLGQRDERLGHKLDDFLDKNHIPHRFDRLPREMKNRSAFAVLHIFQLDFFEFFPAEHFADLPLVKDLNVLTRLHSTREVVRHFVSDVFPANDE